MSSSPPSPPVLNELTQVLATTNRLGRDFNVNPAITRIFRSQDASVGTTDAYTDKRLLGARTLYQNVRDNAPDAIFYKLHDKSRMVQEYQKARRSIRQDFNNYFKSVKYPTTEQKKEYFTSLYNYLERKRPRTEQIKIQMELATFWLNAPNLDSLKSRTKNADQWFTDETNAVKTLAENKFFNTNARTAKAAGTIYNPTEGHNWGTNVAWAIAVCKKGLNIRILSPLIEKNTLRTSRKVPLGYDVPSAFALEMSIAIMMGYRLNFGPRGAVTLQPPSVLSQGLTQGEGNGVLPTAAQQMNIYRVCVLEQLRNNGTLARDIKNWALADHKRWREVLTSPPLADKAAFDTLRTELREIQLVAIANNLINKSKTGDGQSLRDRIVEICRGGNAVDKKDLADALNLMRDRNALLPILDTLSSAEHNVLRTMLTNNPFNVDAYANLRTDVTEIGSDVLYAERLKTESVNDEERLRQTTSDACNGNDGEKTALANALALMQRRNTLIPILDALTATERDSLNTMLRTNLFNSGFYEALIVEQQNVINAHFILQVRSNVEEFRNMVEEIRTGNNATDKQSFVEALAFMQSQNQLEHVLDGLTLDNLQGLNTMLTSPPFAADNAYNELRADIDSTIRIELQADEAQSQRSRSESSISSQSRSARGNGPQLEEDELDLDDQENRRSSISRNRGG